MDEETFSNIGGDYGQCDKCDITDGGNDVLRAQLEQKDKDLILAAELGKALLEKNAELEKKLNQSAEECNQRLEELEQERYGLHLKFGSLGDEYETTVKELQYDITILRDELDRHRQEAQADSKQRSKHIHTLAQQNERLQDELQQCRHREKRLQTQLHDVKNERLASLTNKQTRQIEQLQDQATALTGRNCETERQLEKACEEKGAIMSILEETRDKVKVLEKRNQEHITQLQQSEEEMRDVHEQNSRLTHQIDQLTEKASNSSGHSITLFNELSQLSGNQDITMTTTSPVNQYPPSMFGEDDIECDDEDYLMASSDPVRFADVEHCYRERRSISGEIMQTYRELKQMCCDIREQMSDCITDTDDTTSVDSKDSGSLIGVVNELRDSIRSAIQQSNQVHVSQLHQTQTHHLSEIQCLQHRVGELEHDLAECNGSLHKIQDQLHIRNAHLQQKTYKINELSRQVSSQQEDIKILSSQRDKLQDMLAGDTNKPHMFSAMALLRHARRERDSAVERRYCMEKELQQSKYEIIVLNHQLMEAIHQKNKVSSLLDQWQSDMASLLGVKMEVGAMKLRENLQTKNSTTSDSDT